MRGVIIMQNVLEYTKKVLEFITPIASIIGVFVSMWLGFQTLEMNKLTRKLNEIAMISKEREQADKIALQRVNKPENKFDDIVKNARESNQLVVFFDIRNSSDLPVYDIVVLDVSSRQIVRLSTLEQLYNSNNPEAFNFTYSKSLEPGTRTGYLTGRGNGMGATDDFIYFFRDAQGKTQFRSNDRSLEKVKNKQEMYNILNNIGINAADLSAYEKFGEPMIRED